MRHMKRTHAPWPKAPAPPRPAPPLQRHFCVLGEGLALGAGAAGLQTAPAPLRLLHLTGPRTGKGMMERVTRSSRLKAPPAP